VKPAVRDLLLYVVIGLGLVLAMVLWIFLLPARFQFRVDRTWSMFAWFTALSWFSLVQSFWHIRHSAALWRILALSLVFHTVVYSLLFRFVQPWPGIAYFFTLPAEAMAITYVISKRLKVLPRFAKSNLFPPEKVRDKR